MSGWAYIEAGNTITNNPGGASGQIQWNNNGAFDGFTASGDATINTTTGVVTVLKMSGGATFNYVAKTSTYSISSTDYLIDCTANTFTVTLPSAVGIAGRVYVIKNSGTGVVTVATSLAQTIDGYSSFVLSVQYEAIQVMSDGANWKVF